MYYERKSVPLTEKEWNNLNRIATKHNCIAQGGPIRRPSWRTLLRKIAIGELDVVKKARKGTS